MVKNDIDGKIDKLHWCLISYQPPPPLLLLLSALQSKLADEDITHGLGKVSKEKKNPPSRYGIFYIGFLDVLAHLEHI